MWNKIKVGFFKENPVFGLYLGICSTLAISTSLNNALGMGIAVTFVLLGSNILIALLRKLIPNEIRIPVFIIIIATFVSIIEMLIKAYTPSLYSALGAFISLIVVNCIILGRAEAFASKNTVIDSIVDAIGMGLGYTFSLLLISIIRQIVGTGILELINPFDNSIIFSWQILPQMFVIDVFNGAAGAFITFAILAAIFAKYNQKEAK